MLAAAFGVIRSNRRPGAESLGRNVSPIDAVALQGVGYRVGATFGQTQIIRFLSRAFAAGVALHRDATVGCVSSDNVGYLIDLVSAVGSKIRAIKPEIDVWKIDHDPSASLSCLNVAAFEFFD